MKENKKNNLRNLGIMKKLILIIFSLLFILSLLACKEEKKQASIQKEVKKVDKVNTAKYNIVEVQDQSRKALGKKPLSKYETSELEKLPTNKKILYKIVLPLDLKDNQVKPTIEHIINNLTTNDSDIDEIILWLYSDEEISNGVYDIGTATWAPFGKLGNVDANIAVNNIRDNYEVDYQLRRNIEVYLTQKSKNEDKFNYTKKERKQIFKDIVSAEDKAHEYERIEKDKVFNKLAPITDNNREKLKAEYDKISQKTQQLMNQYKLKVFEKYNITEQQAKEIVREGQEEYWPLE